MTYNTLTPLPPDIPADGQPEFLSNFGLLNDFFGIDHTPFAQVITDATSANPCVITSPGHKLTGGMMTPVTMDGEALGVISPWSINGSAFTVSNITDDTFEINADTTNEKPYIANTGAFQATQKSYGFHKQITFGSPNAVDPNLSKTNSSLYTKTITPIDSELDPYIAAFFQNDRVDPKQLTDLVVVEEVFNIQNNMKGVKTPWGLTINFGNVVPFWLTSPSFLTFELAIPYTVAHYSTIIIPNTTGFLNKTSSPQVENLQLNSFDARVVGQGNGTPVSQINCSFISLGT